VSVLPAVDSYDHPGLFMIRLKRPGAMPAAAKKLKPLAQRRPRHARVAPSNRQKSGLHRYCSACARETEHVAWAAYGRGSSPSIRWPTAEPARGTTICLNCGHWRAATSQLRPRAWSSWPRSRDATRSLAEATDPADSADDSISQTAAENEGMPPKREPQLPHRSSTPPRRLHAVAR
jgi:hypothetical protein